MIKRILLIRPDKIGDLILTLPMATVIKAALPDAHVSFLVRDYTASLLALAADVDKTVIYDTNLSLWKTISFLRSAKPDAVFFFGSKFKLTLAAFLARIPVRVGRAYWWYSFLYNRKIREHRKNAERNEAEYNVRMFEAIGIKNIDTPLPKLDLLKLPKNLLTFSDYVVLHVTTGGSTAAWSEAHFVELAKLITCEFRHPIVLTGISADNEFLFRIASRMKHSSSDVHILAQDDLLILASALKGAKLVVASGTGPGHLAAALGTPTVGLFPAVKTLSKERWGFRGKNVRNISPTILPKPECPMCDHCICTDEITVEQVIGAINDLNIS